MTRVSIGADGYNDNGNAGVGNASIVVPSVTAVPYRGDPTMSNDGSRVFFQSPVGLTPHALNDVQIETVEDTENGTTKFVPVYADNVYEWQQAGVSGCPPSDASGCVYLISDGRDVHTDSPSLPCGQKSDGFDRSAVCLLGTDATGDNVFFSTADQLVPEDTDTQVDIYDAQVCSSSEPCAPHQAPPPEPCQGEQCHGIPEATPSLLAPGTATFNGEGNVASPPPPAKPAVKKKTVTCKRGHVKKKVHKKETCVRKKTKKDKTAKKSSKSKRGGKS
jgi:hypothetical protein